MIQAHVFYSGTVQGVGFRYTTLELAMNAGLTGWVRNLPDGRVELLAEGEKADVDKLLRDIDDYFKGYIASKDIQYEQLDGQQRAKGFMIV